MYIYIYIHTRTYTLYSRGGASGSGFGSLGFRAWGLGVSVGSVFMAQILDFETFESLGPRGLGCRAWGFWSLVSVCNWGPWSTDFAIHGSAVGSRDLVKLLSHHQQHDCRSFFLFDFAFTYARPCSHIFFINCLIRFMKGSWSITLLICSSPSSSTAPSSLS